MIDEAVSKIRTLLESGEILDIGGRPQTRTEVPTTTAPNQTVPATTSRSTTALVAAFAAVYLIWGSTYLAIRYAVQTFPPLLMMGVRHLTAGGLLYGWARWRGTPAPKLREWFHPAMIGAVLFLGGHGSLAWAETRVPSGIAALLVATCPMWIVVLARLTGTERKLSRSALTGLVLGFVGVAVLFGPDVLKHNGELNLMGSGAVLFGTFIWAVGTIWMRSVKMPDSPVISSGMQMFAGGVSLVIAAALTGEGKHFQLAAVTGRSWLALAYLIVFGSIIAFTAYSWLHMVASPSRVSTYAYVNPVVAVLIGWALASEPIGVFTVVAMVIILVGVFLVNVGQKEEHVPARTRRARDVAEEEAVA
jgi:drug/metabolite transporter (DMT)-like permease